MKKAFILFVLLVFLVCIFDPGYCAEYYGIQIASFKSRSLACENVRSLITKGYDCYYRRVSVSGKGQWYVVYVGKYRDRGEALRDGRVMKKEGALDNIIIRVVPTETATASVIKRDRRSSAEPPSQDKMRDKTNNTTNDKMKNNSAKAGNLRKENISDPAPDVYRQEVKKDEPPSLAVTAKSENPHLPPFVKGGNDKVPPLEKLRNDKSPAFDKGGMGEFSDKGHPENSIYLSAMNDFETGRYKKALGKFEEILRQDQLGPDRKEEVLRNLAHCHYFLGEMGSAGDLRNAVDYYKIIVRDYSSNKENATALYRLAGSYINLKFWHEAMGTLETLCSKYPESSYIPDSVFEMGEILYRMQRFDGAIEKFKKYLRNFPNEKYAKRAFFNIGDCYSQMKQFDSAQVWYGDALEKWLGLENVPKDYLLKLGHRYFQAGSYDNAVDAFFVYMNLFPDDEQDRNVLYAIARSFVEMDQFFPALMMLGRLLEKYPGSREAMEGAVIMANIGVKEPGIKAPVFMNVKGMNNYLDPLKTYDDILAKFPLNEMTEGLLYQKGYALWKNKRYKDSFDVYTLLLRQFPDGKYGVMTKKNLVLIADFLVDEYYSKGDYVAVSDIYFKVFEGGAVECGNFKTGLKIGNSLEELTLRDDAMGVYRKLVGNCRDENDKIRVILAMARIDYKKGDYKEAEKRLRSTLLKRSPEVDPGMLMRAKRITGDIYYKRGGFEKAASVYSNVLGSDGAVIYRDYADTLMEMNLYSSAAVNYRKAVEKYDKSDKEGADNVIVDSYAGLGNCYYRDGKYEQAVTMYKKSLSEGGQNLWALYHMGIGYFKSENIPMAEKTFTELKEKGGESFWSYVVDYFMDDNNWTERYREYLAES